MLFFKKKKAKPGVLLATQSGQLMPITQMPDDIFAEKTLGDGVCIVPMEGKVCAPCDGRIVSVADSGHALMIKSDSGAEILIHIGIDTVELNGAGFDAKVKGGDWVKQGQLLCDVDLEQVEKAGYPLHTAIVIANHDLFSIEQAEHSNVVAAQSEILRYWAESTNPGASSRADTGLADG